MENNGSKKYSRSFLNSKESNKMTSPPSSGTSSKTSELGKKQARKRNGRPEVENAKNIVLSDSSDGDDIWFQRRQHIAAFPSDQDHLSLQSSLFPREEEVANPRIKDCLNSDSSSSSLSSSSSSDESSDPYVLNRSVLCEDSNENILFSCELGGVKDPEQRTVIKSVKEDGLSDVISLVSQEACSTVEEKPQEKPRYVACDMLTPAIQKLLDSHKSSDDDESNVDSSDDPKVMNVMDEVEAEEEDSSDAVLFRSRKRRIVESDEDSDVDISVNVIKNRQSLTKRPASSTPSLRLSTPSKSLKKNDPLIDDPIENVVGSGVSSKRSSLGSHEIVSNNMSTDRKDRVKMDTNKKWMGDEIESDSDSDLFKSYLFDDMPSARQSSILAPNNTITQPTIPSASSTRITSFTKEGVMDTYSKQPFEMIDDDDDDDVVVDMIDNHFTSSKTSLMNESTNESVDSSSMGNSSSKPKAKKTSSKSDQSLNYRTGLFDHFSPLENQDLIAIRQVQIPWLKSVRELQQMGYDYPFHKLFSVSSRTKTIDQLASSSATQNKTSKRGRKPKNSMDSNKPKQSKFSRKPY